MRRPRIRRFHLPRGRHGRCPRASISWGALATGTPISRHARRGRTATAASSSPTRSPPITCSTEKAILSSAVTWARPGALHEPHAVAVTARECFVADTGNHRMGIRRTAVAASGANGSGKGQFESRWGSPRCASDVYGAVSGLASTNSTRRVRSCCAGRVGKERRFSGRGESRSTPPTKCRLSAATTACKASTITAVGCRGAPWERTGAFCQPLGLSTARRDVVVVDS